MQEKHNQMGGIIGIGENYTRWFVGLKSHPDSAIGYLIDLSDIPNGASAVQIRITHPTPRTDGDLPRIDFFILTLQLLLLLLVFIGIESSQLISPLPCKYRIVEFVVLLDRHYVFLNLRGILEVWTSSQRTCIGNLYKYAA